MLPDPPLSDGVVTLRGFDSGDVAAIVAVCQDPEIPRWTLVPSPYGADDARDYLRRTADGRMEGRCASFAIADAAAPATLLGTDSLNVIDWGRRAADVGYLLGAPARGNGYATRAVGLLAGWAFGTLGLERLELRAQKENTASRAVARRAGSAPVDAPVVQRPECDQQPDVYFARLRA